MSPTTPADLSEPSERSQVQEFERKPTKWTEASDSELAQEVGRAAGRVIIGFKDPESLRGVYRGAVLISVSALETAKRDVAALGAEILHHYRLSPSVVAIIPPEQAGKLRALATVDYIEPDYPGQWLVEDTTWNVRRVRADYAWNRSAGAGVDLLIIDSGIDNSHSDLDPASVQACDGSNGLDEVGHGTFVSGIAAALNNSIGVVGAAHAVDLWSSRVGGTAGPVPSAVKCAIEYGRINDFFVMSMSMSLGVDSATRAAIDDEIEAAWTEGHVLVAAAGNTSGGSVTYPANHPDVIAVTATDRDDEWAGVGPEASEVELAAPGIDIKSTGVPGASIQVLDCSICTDTVAATSWAAPHVAAGAAVVKSYHSGWSNEDVRERLQETAVDLPPNGRDDLTGFGLLDIAAAVGIDTLDVSISGPGVIHPDDENCTWTAVVSGGVPPYSYEWLYDGGLTVGTNSSWTGGLDSGDIDDEFLLTVWVKDVGGEAVKDDLLVTTDEGTFPCPFF